MLRAPLLISLTAFSFSTCTSAVKQRLFGARDSSSVPAAAAPGPESLAAPSPAPENKSENKTENKPENKPENQTENKTEGKSGAPTPAVGAGKDVILNLQKKAAEPFQTFVHLVSKDVCASGVRAQVLYFPKVNIEVEESSELSTHGLRGATIQRDEEDEGLAASPRKTETASAAAIVRRDCQNIEPETLRPGAATLAGFDGTALIFKNALFNRNDRIGDPLILLCSGAVDGGSRTVQLEVRRVVKDSSLKARLVMKGSGPVETVELPVTEVKKGKMTLYQAGTPAMAPYLAASIGNFNGLTAFTSFDLRFSSVPASRRETNLSFPRCLVP